DTGYAYNLNSAYLDIGDSGMLMQGDGYFQDSLACMVVHLGPQRCLTQCLIDTSLQMSIAQHTVTFKTAGQPQAGYEYIFSNGKDIYAYDSLTSYTFHEAGTYSVLVVISGCCKTDTLYRIIQITDPP